MDWDGKEMEVEKRRHYRGLARRSIPRAASCATEVQLSGHGVGSPVNDGRKLDCGEG